MIAGSGAETGLGVPHALWISITSALTVVGHQALLFAACRGLLAAGIGGALVRVGTLALLNASHSVIVAVDIREAQTDRKAGASGLAATRCAPSALWVSVTELRTLVAESALPLARRRRLIPAADVR